MSTPRARALPSLVLLCLAAALPASASAASVPVNALCFDNFGSQGPLGYTLTTTPPSSVVSGGTLQFTDSHIAVADNNQRIANLVSSGSSYDATAVSALLVLTGTAQSSVDITSPVTPTHGTPGSTSFSMPASGSFAPSPAATV